MAKQSGERWYVVHPATDSMLVGYDNKRQWRFHAFIGDSWPSEAEALAKAEELVKSKAIPPFTYKVIKSR